MRKFWHGLRSQKSKSDEAEERIAGFLGGISNLLSQINVCGSRLERHYFGSFSVRFCTKPHGHLGYHENGDLEWGIPVRASDPIAASTPGEMVNHPGHYGGDVPHETIKCLEAWGLEKDALLWTCCKYLSRSHRKGNQLEDLKKARFYLERRIKELEDGISTSSS